MNYFQIYWGTNANISMIHVKKGLYIIHDAVTLLVLVKYCL